MDIIMKKVVLPSLLLGTLLSANSFDQSQFTPDISLIVDTSFVSHSLKDEELAHLQIPSIAEGIMGGHSHGGHEEAPMNAKNGFNLNYAELSMHSIVDPYFELDGVFHFNEGGVEIEEAYFTSTSLPYNLLVRGGKFRSRFGRINSQHQHVQDFSDMPLVYHAFLGEHGINEVGVSLEYLAPTDLYLNFTLEALQGTNEAMFGNAAIMDGEDVVSPSTSQPNLFVGTLKSALEYDETTLLYGASIAYGGSRVNHMDDETPHAFSGISKLYGLDATLKHYLNSYSYISWQSELLYRDLEGDKYDKNFIPSTLHKEQAGFYTQLLYAYNQNYRVGTRYDSIYKNLVNDKHSQEDLKRYSLMAEYLPSEFTKFRLQYNHNHALFSEDGLRQDLNTIILEVNIAIGAHGAHAF